MALPAPIQELWNVWREIEGNAQRSVTVNLFGPPGEARDGVKSLLLQNSGHPGALQVVSLGEEPGPEADVHIALLDPRFGPTTSQMTVLRRLPSKALVLVLIGVEEGQTEARRREVATGLGVKADQVLIAPTVSALRPLLAKRLISLFSDEAMALSRQFPVLREESANQEVKQTSQQNAIVGVIPVPGADMPVMTANQIKMVLRIAAIYDQPMTAERIREVLAVVGGGFALRTTARQLAKFIPGPGWILGGAMGYAGTIAMGKAAIEYFRRTAEAPAPRVKTSAGDGQVIDAEVVQESRDRS